MSTTMQLQAVQLQEDVASGLNTRVDREAGVIHGVRILGPKSKNKRVYSEPAIREGRPLYEGIRVNYDHPAGSRERSMDDRAGWLQGVHVANGGLSGDLCLFVSDSRAAKVLEAAEKHPGAFGLSHNVRAETRQENGVLIVERITRVESVDIVSDPATTSSLFESQRWSVDTMSSQEFAKRLLEADGGVDYMPSMADMAKMPEELSALKNEVGRVLETAKTVDELVDKLRQILDARRSMAAGSELAPAAESYDSYGFASALTEGSGCSRDQIKRFADRLLD